MFQRPYRTPLARTRPLVLRIVVLLLCTTTQAFAQDVPMEAEPEVQTTTSGIVFTEAEARAELAKTLPDTAPLDDRIRLLTRQRVAGRVLGDQGVRRQVLDQLIVIGKGQPDWAGWMLDAMNTQFVYGSQTRSIEIGEALVAEPNLPPGLRTNALSNLTWKYCQINDVRNCERLYALAQRAFDQLDAGNVADLEYARIQVLQARGEALRNRGDADGRVNALREAVAVARRRQDRVGATTGADPRNGTYRAALNVTDYTTGQLVYALDAQGRSAEGVAVSQDGLARARLGNLGPDALGSWDQRLAAALIGERRYAEALAVARDALVELQRAGGLVNGLQVALARTAEVRALISLERWQEADQTYGAFLDSIRGDRAAYDRSYNSLLYALLAAKNGRLDVATKTIDGNLRYRQRIYGVNHVLTQESRAVRGAIWLIGRSPGNAMSDYEDFFTALLDTPSGWADLAPVGSRGAYLDIVLNEYFRYAMELYASGGPAAIDDRMRDRLVQVTDRLGSGVTQRAILESSAKVRSGDPALVAILGQEQDLRGKVRDAYGLAYADVLAADAKDVPDDRKKQLRDQLRQHRDQAESLQKQLDDVRRTIAKRFPAFLQLVNPVNPNVDTIRKALAPGEAFVGIFPGRDGTFLWAVNANGKTALAISKWTEVDVGARVAALRATLDVGDRLPRLPAIDFAPSIALYDELIRPLRAALAGATLLDISASGALAAVPFATLVSGPAGDAKTAPWLAREFAIAQTPGAAAFVTLRGVDAKSVAAKPLIGFGDPQFRLGAVAATRPAGGPAKARNLVVVANAPQASTYSVEKGFRYASIPALPETREELVALAGALGADPQGDLVLGAAATRKAVLTTPLADRRVVAFATHGLLPGEMPTLSKPALAMAATDDGESPLLNLDDVLTLRLNAQWVVLSACNTAGGERDGVAMSGLVRGFFFAGARSVLATQWAVESESARALVTQIFSGAARDPKAARAVDVQRAQLAMIDGTIGGGNYAHPFYWAPYTLFGDPLR